MKLFLSAYSCQPGCGSEPGVGWNCVRQAARFHDVWVATSGEQRPAIELELSTRPLPNVRFIFLDFPRLRRLTSMGWLGKFLFYCGWQLAALSAGRQLHRSEKLDLVHHVTFGAFWYPTFLSFLRLPFVWGPFSTGLPSPGVFRREFSFVGKLNEWARQLFVIVSALDPLRRQAEKQAYALLVVSPITVGQLRVSNRGKARIFSQVGVDSKEIAELPERTNDAGRDFTVLSVGRLLHWKGFALAIRGFALFHKEYPNTRYCIIGDGPEKATLTQLVSSLGLGDAIHFLSSLSRREYQQQLVNSDVMVQPNLHEPGSYVIAEAMSAQLPVICLDYGEPASLVTAETGIKIKPSNPDRVVKDIAGACARLASTPALRYKLGAAGKRRVLKILEWDKKGEFLASIYEEVGRGRPLSPVNQDNC